MQPYIDLGGNGATMHLAPANGFPPECYQPLADALTETVHTFGYRPRPLHPNSNPDEMRSWHDLSDDLVAELPQIAAQPVIGVGHSLGGILTLYAALERPELFRGLILIDAVILPRRLLPLIWLAKKSGQIYRHPLVQGATRRRDRFADREEIRGRLQGRGVFKDFDTQAFEAYLEHGWTPDGAGLTLAWPKRWEAAIFAAQPTDVWRGLKNLRVPLLIIRGSNSDLLIDRSWRNLQRMLPHATFAELNGGHMIPLEQPAAVATVIRDWLTHS